MISIAIRGKVYSDIDDIIDAFQKGVRKREGGMKQSVCASLLTSCIEWKARGLVDRDKLLILSGIYVRGEDARPIIRESLEEMIDYMRKSRIKELAFATLILMMDDREAEFLKCNNKYIDYGWEW